MLEALDNRIVPSNAHFVSASSSINAGTGALTVTFHEAGLGNTTQVTAKTLVSFNHDLWTPIVDTLCVVCHFPGGSASFMDLSISSSDVVNNKWVNIAANPGTGPSPLPSCGGAGRLQVIPNDPTNSLVYQKIRPSPTCGVQMPDGGPYLSASDIQKFFDWISQGANDN